MSAISKAALKFCSTQREPIYPGRLKETQKVSEQHLIGKPFSRILHRDLPHFVGGEAVSSHHRYHVHQDVRVAMTAVGHLNERKSVRKNALQRTAELLKLGFAHQSVLGVDVLRDQQPVQVAGLFEQLQTSDASRIARHVDIVADLIVTGFDAEQVVLQKGAELGELKQFFFL